MSPERRSREGRKGEWWWTGGIVRDGMDGAVCPPGGTLPLGGAGVSPSGQPRGRNPTGSQDVGVVGRVCPGGGDGVVPPG